jgi:hypothetical protein
MVVEFRTPFQIETKVVERIGRLRLRWSVLRTTLLAPVWYMSYFLA